MGDTKKELRKYKNMSSETKYLNSEYKDFFEKSLLESDPEIFKAINDELVRQQNHCLLYTSPSPRD